MSALDDARAVMADFNAPGWAKYDPAGMKAFVSALAALVAECESERAQLGELLVRAVEAWGGVFVEHFKDDREWFAAEPGSDLNGQHGPTLPDALRALLAKVEGA